MSLDVSPLGVWMIIFLIIYLLSCGHQGLSFIYYYIVMCDVAFVIIILLYDGGLWAVAGKFPLRGEPY